MTLSCPASNLINGARLSAPSRRSGRRLGSRLVATIAAGVTALLATGCDRSPPAPFAEFVIAAGDSTFWVRSDNNGIRMRGAPLVLARHSDRFYELYVVDDDLSYENAYFIGERLYQRDLVTGDSTEIFRDSLVAKLADAYGRKHPGDRKLGPDDELNEEASTSASVELSVLAVHGPYLSMEYHVDTSGTGDDTWHMTRHAVLDMRTGRRVALTDLLGKTLAGTVLGRARRLYRETVDSVLKDERPLARRAAQSISRFRFDPGSFALAAPSGAPMIAFSAPGQGSGGEGFVLPLQPIAVSEPGWWADVREALPTSSTDGEERWRRRTYTVRAVYDTIVRPVRLVLADTSGREYMIGGVTAPVHRIYWLDSSSFDQTQRRALIRAFDEAASYDEAIRTASAILPRGAVPTGRPSANHAQCCRRSPLGSIAMTSLRGARFGPAARRAQ